MNAMYQKADANERIRAAFPEMEPSGGHDHVDEIIGLLRIARMHIKDAEDRAQRLFEENKSIKEGLITFRFIGDRWIAVPNEI